jgi:hypothetical protein
MISNMGPGSSELPGQILVVEKVFIWFVLVILASSDCRSSSKDDPDTSFGGLLDLLIELFEARIFPVWS